MTVSLLGHNRYGVCNQGMQHLKRCVFRRLRKTDNDAATAGAAILKILLIS